MFLQLTRELLEWVKLLLHRTIAVQLLGAQKDIRDFKRNWQAAEQTP